MALTQSQIESRIAALRSARDSGVLMVRHGETQTNFRSLAEMNAILADLETQLASATASAPRVRKRYAVQLTKGL